MAIHRQRRSTSPRSAAVLALVLITAGARTACAAPFSAGGGLDYYSGPGGQTTTSVLAIVGANLGQVGSGSIAALRYDDNRSGRGNGVAVGLSMTAAPALALKAWGTDLMGDQSLRAWRLKTGPAFSAWGSGSLGLYYSHYEDNTAREAHSDGAIAEAAFPLLEALSGRVSLAAASLPAHEVSSEAQAGIEWSPVHALQLEGAFGVARNGSVTNPTAPASGPLHGILSGLLGGGGASPSSTTRNHIDPMATLGLRVLLP